METFNFLSISIFIFLLFLLYKLLNKPAKNLPPSPPSYPIIGHIHLLKKPLHRTFHSLSNKFGPILFLQLGFCRVLVISSPSAVEECFSKNDIVFASRPHLLAGKHFGYNFTAIGWAPYGQHWRNLRRIFTIEVFSSNSVQHFSSIRKEEIESVIKHLVGRFSGGEGFVKVEMKSLFLELVLNVMMRIVAGKKFIDYGDDERKKKIELDNLREMFVPNVSMNLGDFFPVLKWFNFIIGIDKKLAYIHRKRDAYLQNLVVERCKNRENDLTDQCESKKVFIDVLLKLQETEPEQYPRDIVNGLIGIFFTAGTDTSALTMEWVMSALLNHPDVLEKVMVEINLHVGNHRLLDENDLPKLPYLHSVINETMRLYPVAPLSVPHVSSEECTVGGYGVPRGTILLTNIWAVHKDPKAWDDPMEFKPERFIDALEKDKEGKLWSYSFLPFGMGRRGCPGNLMGMQLVSLVLGRLIQCFEWGRLGNEEVDMSEGPGLTMPIAKPLVAVCKPRQAMMDFLTKNLVDSGNFI
ncbi:hypothetical protein C5167_013815 [Papaver somniferum]|uniref:Cytochrome P450 n=1 Tax=Papaver somniferum TaxID=3469 RepID=A0A4Y7J1F2_PAPSO|nr:isoflavone 3'-hydroxylase-like [Papaver somniferum]XP_026455947.1 isoflavone 3'-hydroxylase-like [Papaver somniferum]RZC54964.1 hypothetical protein C5167_013815 [Papaver somniferum]